MWFLLRLLACCRTGHLPKFMQPLVVDLLWGISLVVTAADKEFPITHRRFIISHTSYFNYLVNVIVCITERCVVLCLLPGAGG